MRNKNDILLLSIVSGCTFGFLAVTKVAWDSIGGGMSLNWAEVVICGLIMLTLGAIANRRDRRERGASPKNRE